ncbi:MAG: ABC transporter ATP-binding protein, partial [Clostridia bacterium]|nr:ABC transporter ATP-binding protein [Clostridia bacterium]
MKVTLEKVTKRYGKTLAADAVSAQLRDGALTALLGPSGCGKTTLLNVLAGIVPVTEGRVLFDEEDVTAWPPEKRNIGLVFQNYALYPHMTVLKNICFPLEIQRIPPQERLQRAQAIAALVHVQDLLNRKPDELSGGQQQRVAIARALVKEPRLLLLDEPLSNLDARLRLEMREEIRRIQRRTGVTTVFVTHDQEEAMSIADEIFLMRFGCLQQCAAPQTLYNEPSGLFVAEFLGNPPINRLAGFMQEGRFTLQDRSWSIPLGGVAVADG